MSHSSCPPIPPVWWEEFRRLFQAGVAHCFLVGGDIHGVTAYDGLPQQQFVQGALTREVVAWYHPAHGITFPLPSMRETALEILGPDWQPPPSNDDPYAAALDAAGVRAAPRDIFRSARKPAQALAILNDLLHAPSATHYAQVEEGRVLVQGRLAVILDQADLIIPAAGKAQMNDERLATLATLLAWGHDPVLARQQNPVLFFTSHVRDIHPDLLISSSGYRVIEQPLPDEQTRLAYLAWYLHEHRREVPIPLLDLTVEELARITAGLNLRQVEDVLLVGASKSNHPTGVNRSLVRERKDAIIRQEFQEVITMLDPLPGGFAHLGGMQAFTMWFRQEVIEPLRAGRLREVPKGILLAGPPGVGKTLVVSAAATELGFNAIQLHMAQVLGGIVGSSEQNLQRVFDLARNLAPTFLFIDEIDQTLLSRRGDGSGSPVAANLFGAMLQFFGDPSLYGRVMIVGATNQPERLDPALRRPGRFDVTFPLVSPDCAGRFEILAILAQQQGTRLTSQAHQLLSEETERYSGADLAAVINEARFLAGQASQNVVEEVQARAALENIRPATLANVEMYTRSAIEACTNLRYLPPTVAASERARLATSRRVPNAEQMLQPGLRTARQL
ncbi:MAG TPA: ATP-binding protein [Ktedonobacteraceae bacterium]